ncbi:hypothetical protein CLOM_g5686 [Closterium sp. NIES-68]|nr:hypothetical protein CLOM_g5686 [Closterium sp. NIES-68]GJP64041.1 hypothetical protein CLOP_g21074 [Closterium sp. NIES-67]
MATISAIAARQSSIKPRAGGATTDSVETTETVIVILPDGSIRLFADDSSSQTGEKLSAQIVLSEYPDMHLTVTSPRDEFREVVSLLSPTSPLVPGEIYCLTPKRHAAPPAISPPFTPPRTSGSRDVTSPFLPPTFEAPQKSSPFLPPTRRLRGAASSNANTLARSVHRDLRAAVETVARVSSPGCCNVRREREERIAKRIAESGLGFAAPRNAVGANRRSSVCSAARGEAEDEEEAGDSMEQLGLFKSKSVEIPALSEEIYIADVPASLPAAATTAANTPPSASREGSSVKANVLATLAQFKPRSFRRFPSFEKNLQSASAAANGADAEAAMVHSASESAQDCADVDTRIGHRQPRNGGGGDGARAGGYAQNGVAWAAPSQITWGDQHGSRTVSVRPGADFASLQSQRSPPLTTEHSVPLCSSICRSCNGISNCCSCEVQCAPQADLFVRPASVRCDALQSSQCRPNAALENRRSAADYNEYVMPPRSQVFLSEPLAGRAIF